VGYTDKKIDNEITYLPLSNANYWAVRLDGVSVNSINLQLQARHVIFDTGTSMNYIPSPDYETLVRRITSGKKCKTVSKYIVKGNITRDNVFCDCS
jgi:hypothetical protein